jgi:hypothetical protein
VVGGVENAPVVAAAGNVLALRSEVRLDSSVEPERPGEAVNAGSSGRWFSVIFALSFQRRPVADQEPAMLAVK